MASSNTVNHQGAANAGPLGDHSGASTGATQVVIAENIGRKYLLFQNQSDEVMYVNFGAAAVQDKTSIKVPANTFIEWSGSFVPNESFNQLGTTVGKAFACKEG